MSITTYGVFLVPITDVGDRCSITLTILLTAVAFRFILQESLPQMSYLTTLDWYVLGNFVLIFTNTILSLLAATYVPSTPQITNPLQQEHGLGCSKWCQKI